MTADERITELEAENAVLRKRRQVHELPPVRLQVTQHQALHGRCLNCQRVTTGRFPAAVSTRVQWGVHVLYDVVERFCTQRIDGAIC